MTPPPTIDQLMQEIKQDRPHLSPEDLAYIRSRIEWDRYQNNLIGAINRSKVQELKAA